MENEVNKWRMKSDMGAEIDALSSKELEDAFSGNLSFGTGGIRGVLGPGTNRLNKYIIAKVTYGLGNYLTKKYLKSAVVIAYDNRHYSPEFAKKAAETLTHFGIKVYLFSTLAPTPALSFAVRHYKAQGGIVITASHNPKEYNGYKVYDETGCQLNLTDSAQLIEEVAKVADIFDLVITPKLNLIEMIDEELFQAYLAALEQVNYRTVKSNLKIVYTPLHGAAYRLVSTALKKRGHQVFEVKEQCVPDPNFSATKSANPEEVSAYEKALNLAKEVEADIILATDPDGDRVGVVAHDNYQYHFLNGNQTGGLLIDYVLGSLKAAHKIIKNPVVYNTIVTSSFGAQIAKSYNVKTVSTLTGFKFIGEKIRQNEVKGADGDNFVFGYEESYGYLLNSMCRDKDAVQAALIIAEMAAYLKNGGMNLMRQLDYLYRVHGFFAEGQISLTLKGKEGKAKIDQIIADFRTTPITSIANNNLITMEDYLNSYSLTNNVKTPILLPSSDVLKFIYDCGSFIAVRPSGTEPKLKIYFAIRDGDNAETKLAKAKKQISDLLQTKYNINS